MGFEYTLMIYSDLLNVFIVIIAISSFKNYLASLAFGLTLFGWITIQYSILSCFVYKGYDKRLLKQLIFDFKWSKNLEKIKIWKNIKLLDKAENQFKADKRLLKEGCTSRISSFTFNYLSKVVYFLAIAYFFFKKNNSLKDLPLFIAIFPINLSIPNSIIKLFKSQEAVNSISRFI